jgi:hypothetical protein
MSFKSFVMRLTLFGFQRLQGSPYPFTRSNAFTKDMEDIRIAELSSGSQVIAMRRSVRP